VPELARLKAASNELAAAITADAEGFGQGVDGLGADTVQADAELEDIVIVFGTGVDLGDAIHDLAQGDAAAVVTDRDSGAVNLDLHLAPVAHDVFINGIVHNLLQEDVASVIVVRPLRCAHVHAVRSRMCSSEDSV